MQYDVTKLSREQLERLVLAHMANNQRKLTLKVAKAGGVSVYGLGRYPVTLYKSQWAQLLDMADAIREFIAANDGQLSQGKASLADYQAQADANGLAR